MCQKLFSDEITLTKHIDECLTMKKLNDDKIVFKTSYGEDSDYMLARKLQEQQDEESLRQEEKSRVAKPNAKPFAKPYAKPYSKVNTFVNRAAFYMPPITCPYMGCGKQLEAWEFHSHAATLHSTLNQQYACPICTLGSDVFYAVTDKTNLLQHLKNHHADTAPGVAHTPVPTYNNEDEDEDDDSSSSVEDLFGGKPYEPIYNPRTPTTAPNPPISTNSAKYVETTLSKNLDMECTICFEPFNLGQVIVTIECMCVYHKTCANNWWKKKEFLYLSFT